MLILRTDRRREGSALTPRSGVPAPSLADAVEVQSPDAVEGDPLHVGPEGDRDRRLEQGRVGSDFDDALVDPLHQGRPLGVVHFALGLARQFSQFFGRRARILGPSGPLADGPAGNIDEEVASVGEIRGPAPHADLVLGVPV